MSLSVELLPARHGDAILVRWGPPGVRHRMLVDGGPAIAYADVGRRVAEVATDGLLDLLVLTHVDADHVEGVILLVNDAAIGIRIREIWFNGRRHLGGNYLHGAHGEMLSSLIASRRVPWNHSFGGNAVYDGDPHNPVVLAGGLQVTVLAPSSAALRALQDPWGAACKAAGLDGSEEAVLAALRARPRLVPADTYLGRAPVPDVRALAHSSPAPDVSVTNASTIVLLLELDGESVLLCGDSTPAALTAAVRSLLAARRLDRLAVSAMTVPHHGSARNITPELLGLVPSRRYLFSSDGGYHGHPHAAAVATVLEFGPPGAELVFNYATGRSVMWDDDRLRRRYDFRVVLPDSPGGGVLVELGSGLGR